MASFDPAAATAAYMAQLSPAAHAKATAYTQGGHWLLLWGWLVTVAVCILIARSRVLEQVRAVLEREKPRPLLVSFVVSVLFIALDWILELPWASYAGWWREAQYGLTSQSWGGWFTDNAIVVLVQLPVVGVFFVALYALVRHSPRTWPIWTGVLVGAFILLSAWAGPAVIEPLVNHYTPAPRGEVRDLVVSMGKAYGVPTDKIFVYNGSKQSNRYTANVAGLFGTARVAMSDTMFAQGADLAEVRGVVGHEMGHYVLHHVLWGTLFEAVMAALAALGVLWLFPVVRTGLGVDGIAGLADPSGLPIVYLIFATLSLLATPILNTQTRMQEAAADSFSLEHANEPDGLAKALVKTIEYRASSPSNLEEVIFYNHPSVEHRVRKAMDWKATHPPRAPDAP
jgi:STE24 endopeptidase